jgi:elongation factor G
MASGTVTHPGTGTGGTRAATGPGGPSGTGRPFATRDIRNAVLLGHAHCGKTSLADAVLHVAGANTRQGRVDDGSSAVDTDPEERERHQSVDSHVMTCPFSGREINLLDAPGMPDFVHAAIDALSAAEIACVVVSATAGVELGTRRLHALAREQGLARFIVINKCDAEAADPPAVLAAVQSAFGRECLPVNLPDGAGRAFRSVTDVLSREAGAAMMPLGDARTRLIEAAVEGDSDESLMLKYLAGDEIPEAELLAAVRRAVAAGRIAPVVFASARTEVGVREMLAAVSRLGPCPAELAIHRARTLAGDAVAVSADEAGDFVGEIFKVAHPQRGKVVFVRVLSGTLKPDTLFHINADKQTVKAGHLYRVVGDKLAETPEAVAGEIVAVAAGGKLESLHLHDLLHGDGEAAGRLAAAVAPPYPTPMYSLAVEPKSRGDSDKVSQGLAELAEEDPTLRVSLDRGTGERVINGLGELHIRTALNRLRRRRGLEVETHAPKIPYRETVTAAARGIEYTHKKQSGGAGQYARVVIDLEPAAPGTGYEFVDAIHGGTISQAFRPSVDKGIQAKMAEGVVAGYPVADVRVTLVDGKEHPVDSKDIAFQVAGREAFKKAFAAAQPAILEPIVRMELTVPADTQGVVGGHLSAHRGRIVGGGDSDEGGAAASVGDGLAVMRAEIPLAEVAAFSARMRSATGGRGAYVLELARYEPVPASVQAQLIAAHKAESAAGHGPGHGNGNGH